MLFSSHAFDKKNNWGSPKKIIIQVKLDQNQTCPVNISFGYLMELLELVWKVAIINVKQNSRRHSHGAAYIELELDIMIFSGAILQKQA